MVVGRGKDPESDAMSVKTTGERKEILGLEWLFEFDHPQNAEQPLILLFPML